MKTFNTTLEEFLKEAEDVANKEIQERLANIAFHAIELQRGRVIDEVLEKLIACIKTTVQTFQEYDSHALKVNVTFEIEKK